MKNVFEILLPNLKSGVTDFNILLDEGTWTLMESKLVGISKQKPNYTLFMSSEQNINTDWRTMFMDCDTVMGITKIQDKKHSYIGEIGVPFIIFKKETILIRMILDSHPEENDYMTPTLYLVFNHSK